MRARLCRYCADWHDLAKPWPHNCRPPPPARSSAVPVPTVFRDGMTPLLHPATNRAYDSRAEYNAATREVVAEKGWIEVGSEELKDTRYVNAVSKDDVAQAVQMVKQGYKPTVQPEELPE